MKKYIIVLLMLLALVLHYGYTWWANYTGTISVTVPKETEIRIIGEDDSIYTKIANVYTVPLSYGRYIVNVPEFKIECIIHKNNRGNASITVTDVNEFKIQVNSNAWLVK